MFDGLNGSIFESMHDRSACGSILQSTGIPKSSLQVVEMRFAIASSLLLMVTYTVANPIDELISGLFLNAARSHIYEEA